MAIVTGAAQGIGKAIAERLAADGATVVVVDINGRREGGRGRSAARRSRSRATSPTRRRWRRCTRRVAQGRRLDVLVNNAAIVPFVAWDELDLEDWRKIIDVNLTAPSSCARRADLMRKNGQGPHRQHPLELHLRRHAEHGAYVAAKGGVFAFTRALATELGGYGITVNAVTPGLTETEGVKASPHNDAFGFVEMLQAIKGKGKPGTSPARRLPRLGRRALDHRPDAQRRCRHGAPLGSRRAITGRNMCKQQRQGARSVDHRADRAGREDAPAILAPDARR